MDNNIKDNEQDHKVSDHDSTKKTRDHYHDEHHFDMFGNHDDVKEDDFNWKKSIYTSRRNLTFRLTLSGMILAIAIAATSIDLYLEHLIIPIDGVILPTRFLDILVITLSIGSLGPIFSSLIAFIVPWIHMLIHGGGAIHNPLSSLVDAFGYFIVIWVLWLFYYFVFKNSYTHKNPNKKVDLFKRWLPMVAFVPIVVVLFTMINVLIIYINSAGGEEAHTDESKIYQFVKLFHEDHDHDEHEHHHANWGNFSSKMWVYTFIIFGIELARFSICYTLFGLIEPQMKKINHIFK
ncbi:ECF transporter S component [Spiroplasma turonicum]|uniref:Transmembrane protein n=1 Tax=Spiroplasma turonicum TaxID=216946 RepID=A0A0K1P720_9MOLU|nr:ECF transporter S component [Spiroplasma turonicum]AKU80111.1 transmembrane protein [Spiroplasma turonicum]ALX71111.1 transmembrane protein [Spiroplasma turonicum]